MNTNFKDSVFAKVTTGFVAIAAGFFMLGGAAIAPAYAQSNNDLQAQIQSLLETIASLQAQIGGDSAGFSSCPSSIFTASLGQGANSPAVQDLQVFLNSDADTQVAAFGPGSPGNETAYFGSLTASAVSAFQTKYSASVLAPLGLASATGFWGPSSISKAQSVCAAATDDSDSDSDSESDDSDSDNDSDSKTLNGGEASLESFDIDDVDDVQEGDSAEVADVEFDVEDGDVRVSRIDVALRQSGADGDDEPWDVFEEISIIVDGEEIASMDASDEDDYLNDDGDAGADENWYEVRFSNLDFVVREGDTAEFTIAVETQSSVEDADLDVSWEVNILEDGIRAIDGEGINKYTPEDGDGDEVEFDIEEEGQDDELTINTSSEDPDESTIVVNEDDTSDEYGVFAFDVEADDNDIELNELKIDLNFGGGATASSSDYDDIVNDAYIEIDGDRFDIDDDSSAGSASSTLSFDIDGDYTIDADDEVTVMLFLEFNDQDGNYPTGTTIQASITANDNYIDAEGADDLENADLEGGTLESETHTLRVSGIYTDGAADIDTDSNDSRIQYTFEVDLTAFEEDAYIQGGDVTTDGSTGTLRYSISSAGNGTTTLVDIVSSANEVSTDVYEISQNDTETFTITIEFNANDKSSHRATLNAIEFGPSSGDLDAETYNFVPSSDFRSGLKAETTSN